jgi:hypothetical protein
MAKHGKIQSGISQALSNTVTRSTYNRFHAIAYKRDGLHNCGPFKGNNFVHLGALTGTLYPPDLLLHAYVSKENSLFQKMKEELKRPPTEAETSQMLRNIAKNVQICESSAESGTCEPNRKHKKMDFCALGQPFFTVKRSCPQMPCSIVR